MSNHDVDAPALDLFLGHRGSFTYAALFKNRLLIGLEIDHPDFFPQVGALFHARVTRVRPALGFAEIDLGDHGSARLKIKELQEGQSVEVLWQSPAREDKGARVLFVKKIQTILNTTSLIHPGLNALERIKKHPYYEKFSAHVQIHTSDNVDCFDLDGELDKICAKTIKIKNKTSIIFEQTAALHAIDINSSLSPIEANTVALEEIARQLCLRNISGTIVIDLAGDKRKLAAGLIERMRAFTALDPCRVQVFGITKLGLMELTRERHGWPLAQLLKAL